MVCGRSGRNPLESVRFWPPLVRNWPKSGVTDPSIPPQSPPNNVLTLRPEGSADFKTDPSICNNHPVFNNPHSNKRSRGLICLEKILLVRKGAHTRLKGHITGCWRRPHPVKHVHPPTPPHRLFFFFLFLLFYKRLSPINYVSPSGDEGGGRAAGI